MCGLQHSKIDTMVTCCDWILETAEMNKSNATSTKSMDHILMIQVYQLSCDKHDNLNEWNDLKT